MAYDKTIKKIVKKINETQDHVLAMEFTRKISSLLAESGVFVNVTIEESENDDNNREKYMTNIKKTFGVSVDGLDFSEHDKKFDLKIKDLQAKNEEMKECMEELKEKLDRSVDLSIEPIEAANQIINLTYKRTTSPFEQAVIGCSSVREKMYGIDELKKIADHILVYCKYNQSGADD